MRHFLSLALLAVCLAGCEVEIESTNHAAEMPDEYPYMSRNDESAERPVYRSGFYDPAIDVVIPEVDPDADWQPKPWPEGMPKSEPVIIRE